MTTPTFTVANFPASALGANAAADALRAALAESDLECEVGLCPVGGSVDLVVTPIGRHAHRSEDDLKGFVAEALLEALVRRS